MVRVRVRGLGLGVRVRGLGVGAQVVEERDDRGQAAEQRLARLGRG